MQTYVLLKEAEKDLRETAQNTLKEWSGSAFQKYKSGLSKKFHDIGKNGVLSANFRTLFRSYWLQNSVFTIFFI